jgi:hypothetical protein
MPTHLPKASLPNTYLGVNVATLILEGYKHSNHSNVLGNNSEKQGISPP